MGTDLDALHRELKAKRRGIATEGQATRWNLIGSEKRTGEAVSA
jgi:hypothetical protein